MLWRLVIILLVLLVQGCVLPKQKELPRDKVLPQKISMKQVVILVSEDIPAYSEIAKALAKQLGKRGSVTNLGEDQLGNIKMLAAYRNDENKQFVSIGLNAAVAAKSLINRQVVFCQVFNYQDYNLLTSRHKGVSMMPSMSRTFGTWKALAPDISDIGVISGPGFEDMIQTARVAAASFGIKLHHETVNSDKEYLYAYKQMADTVQGYWLLPDNRVLSGNLLRDVMTFSVRNSKQVAVFSDELLNLGGLFSTVSDYQDIAQHVLDRLEKAQIKETIPGPDLVYLDKLNLRINSVMAQRLSLKIPEQFKKYESSP